MNNPFGVYEDREPLVNPFDVYDNVERPVNPFEVYESTEPTNPFERSQVMDSMEYCRECDQEFPSSGSQFCSVQCQETFEQMTGLTVEEFDVVIEAERVHRLAVTNSPIFSGLLYYANWMKAGGAYVNADTQLIESGVHAMAVILNIPVCTVHSIVGLELGYMKGAR